MSIVEFPAATAYRLRVAAVADVGPRMRRITLAGPQLADFVALPGQDVVVHLSDASGGGVSRRYTIRHLDAARCTLDLDVVLHGHGPGAAWASSVEVGCAVDVFGPRGKVAIATASWQLFVGDDSALPAIAEMVAALPATTASVALIEVTDTDDEQQLDAAGPLDVAWLHRAAEPLEVGWLHRDAVPAGGSDLFDAALQRVQWPAGDRHAYVFAESRVVRRIRDGLVVAGFSKDEISAKGYWNLDRASSD